MSQSNTYKYRILLCDPLVKVTHRKFLMNNHKNLLIILFLIIILSFVHSVNAQQDLCSCSCCIGVACSPFVIGSFYIPSCTVGTCLQQCRNYYPQCQAYPPDGQVSAQCLTSMSPIYNCQCDCCNSGSVNCIPTFAGYSSAYVCQTSSCSISCATQYPSQCVTNHNGQTSGTCTGLISTTTTSLTTNIAGTSYMCSCMCCSSGSNCSPNVNVGSAIAYTCSPQACTQACQSRYPTICPSVLSIGQTNGLCTNQIGGNTRCQCRCCTTAGCSNYETSTNGGCTSCYQSCQLSFVCGSTASVTYSCITNESKISNEFSSYLMILLLLIFTFL